MSATTESGPKLDYIALELKYHKSTIPRHANFRNSLTLPVFLCTKRIVPIRGRSQEFLHEKIAPKRKKEAYSQAVLGS